MVKKFEKIWKNQQNNKTKVFILIETNFVVG
jgi:hypothetical protein